MKRARWNGFGLWLTLAMPLGLMMISGPKAGATSANIVYYDQGGMPACIANPADPQDGLLILWNHHNPYRRPIYGALLSNHQADQGCQEWPSVVRRIESAPLWYDQFAPMPEGLSRYEGVNLPPQVLTALARIRRGMNVNIAETTAGQYLADHPLARFDVQTNRSLTAQFGAGFTAEIYRAFLLQNPKNQAFYHRVLFNAEHPIPASRLSQLYRPYQVWIAKGYMQNTVNDRLINMENDLKADGISFHAFASDPMGAVTSNAHVIEGQLLNLLQSGQNLIVVGVSKGMPELLTAIADIDRTEGHRAWNFPGHIHAVVSLCGMISGSFLVDWASQFPLNMIANMEISSEARQMQMQITTQASFYNMQSRFLNPLLAQDARWLPQNLPYFNVVGILGGDGLARGLNPNLPKDGQETEIHDMQTSLTVPYLGFSGANDGFIEYPGTQIPSSWVRQVVTLAFNSSHLIVDGTFDRFDMKTDAGQKAVVDALFQAIAQTTAKQ